MNKGKNYTIKNLQKDFSSEEKCLRYIFTLRYGDGPACDGCGKGGFHPKKGRKSYACQWCGYQISPLAGTIFHKSSTPLTLWFHAIFLMSKSRSGVSAKELQRHIGVTYKTAWRMQKQIRGLMAQDLSPLSGIVEVDETYVGGRKRPFSKSGKRGRGAPHKTAVVGLAQRKGRIRAKVVPNVKVKTVMPIMRKSIHIGARVMTDDFSIYDGVKRQGFRHKAVKHSRKEYVRGNVHTNTIEGFWSQMKRSIHGTYHAVSPKHLQSYVDEFAYRYNHDEKRSPLFFSLLWRVVSLAVPSA